MKRLPRSRVTSRKDADVVLPLNAEKHESRIQHYLDLANIVLSTKKPSHHSRGTKKSA
jgi:hypothetical protein